MKYYVQVNRHMMSTVEASSALMAEHFFLDLDGIQYSNAFSDEDRKTDTFRGALLDCDTFSVSEIKNLSTAYTAAWATVAQKADDRKTARHEVERLEELLHTARAEEAAAERAYQESLTAASAAKKNLFLEAEG